MIGPPWNTRCWPSCPPLLPSRTVQSWCYCHWCGCGPCDILHQSIDNRRRSQFLLTLEDGDRGEVFLPPILCWVGFLCRHCPRSPPLAPRISAWDVTPFADVSPMSSAHSPWDSRIPWLFGKASFVSWGCIFPPKPSTYIALWEKPHADRSESSASVRTFNESWSAIAMIKVSRSYWDPKSFILFLGDYRRATTAAISSSL
jgi:hypothetical protein